LNHDSVREASDFFNSLLGYEPGVIALLDRLYADHPDAVFFDIGALHGYYAALVGTRFPGWQVAAFEPNPEAFSVLEANFQRLEIKGQALRRAVNAMGDDLHFRGRTIVAPSTPDAIIVSGVRFDDMHTAFEAAAKIVKIDVHGAEGLVLDGMREALIKVVTGLLVEIHAEHLIIGNYTYAAMLERLEESGFDVFEVENFRHSNTPALERLVSDRREQFVDFARWTPEQISHERLLFAMRKCEGPS